MSPTPGKTQHPVQKVLPWDKMPPYTAFIRGQVTKKAEEKLKSEFSLTFKGNKGQGEGAGERKKSQKETNIYGTPGVLCQIFSHLLSYTVSMWQSQDLNAGLSDPEAFVPSTPPQSCTPCGQDSDMERRK